MATLITKECQLIIVGKTGSGKSSLGNSLLGHSGSGEQPFEARMWPTSVTSQCQRREAVLKDGTHLDIVDTPGLFDTNFSNEETTQELWKSVALCAPGPHAILFVLRIGRYTQEEIDSVDILMKMFGTESINYFIVVFTGKDQLGGCNLDEFVKNSPQYLTDFVTKCDSRYVGISNEPTSPTHDRDVKEVMELIYKTMEQNDNQIYSQEVFAEAERVIQQEIERKKQELIDEEIKQREKRLEKDEIERKTRLEKEERERQERIQKEDEERKLRTEEEERQRKNKQKLEEKELEDKRQILAQEGKERQERFEREMVERQERIQKEDEERKEKAEEEERERKRKRELEDAERERKEILENEKSERIRQKEHEWRLEEIERSQPKIRDDIKDGIVSKAVSVIDVLHGVGKLITVIIEATDKGKELRHNKKERRREATSKSK